MLHKTKRLGRSFHYDRAKHGQWFAQCAPPVTFLLWFGPVQGAIVTFSNAIVVVMDHGIAQHKCTVSLLTACAIIGNSGVNGLQGYFVHET